MDFLLRGSRSKGSAADTTKRISTPAGQRLSTIVEGRQSTHESRRRPPPEAKMPPTSPLANMPASKRMGMGAPPLADAEKKPPEYTDVWDNHNADPRLSAERRDWQGKKAQRGGWKRVGLLAAIILACIIALAVGLGVGLTNHKSDKSASQQQQPSNSAPNGSSATDPDQASSSPQPFPIGPWSFETFLSTIETNCTSNPATWTCPPSVLYNTNHAASQAVYNWDITSTDPTNPSNSTLQIASANTGFLALTFPNTSMALLDQGKASERYTFKLNMQRQVIPTAPLTNSASQSICYYNTTTLTASLYTRMAKSYDNSASRALSTGSTAKVSGQTRQQWATAVRVEQVSGGGDGTPDCYPTTNNQVSGPRITSGLDPQPDASLCSCLYLNWTPNYTY